MPPECFGIPEFNYKCTNELFIEPSKFTDAMAGFDAWTSLD